MEEKYIPKRRCIGCMKSLPKSTLLRITDQNGRAVPDPENTAPGRGVYICKDPECLGKARSKKALARNFKRKITDEEYAAVEKAIAELSGKDSAEVK